MENLLVAHVHLHLYHYLIITGKRFQDVKKLRISNKQRLQRGAYYLSKSFVADLFHYCVCCSLLVFFVCLVYPLLPVFLDVLFLIATSVFSSIYCWCGILHITFLSYLQVKFDYTYIDPGVDDEMSKKSRYFAPKVSQL